MRQSKSILTPRHVYGAFWLVFGLTVIALATWGLRDHGDDSHPLARAIPEQPHPKRALPSMAVSAANGSTPANLSRDPVTLVRAMSGASPNLAIALERWLADVDAGRPTREDHLAEVANALSPSSLSFDDLYGLGRSLHGLRIALPVYRAAVDQAERELAMSPSNASAVKRIAAPLRDIGDRLWALKDGWEAAEKLYAILLPLDPVHPLQARTSGYLHAEMIYMQGRCEDAANIFGEYSRTRAGSLTSQEKAKWDYALGVYLFYADRFTEAVPHLKGAADQETGRRRTEALPLLILALLRTDEIEQATRLHAQMIEEHPESLFATQISMELSARRRQQLANRASGNGVAPVGQGAR